MVGQAKESSSRTSILNLLMKSETHRDALVRILKEAQVPKDVPIEKFVHIIENVLATSNISFSDSDLTPQGIGHNRVLYITVRCNGRLLP